MFKMTSNDLARKTDAQLSALFQMAAKSFGRSSTDTASAQSLLTMIRAEIARRGPRL